MSTIVLRSVKGSPLTNQEVDDNFSNLNSTKLEVSSPYAVGDIVYANTTTTFAKLSGVATGNALISGGVGVAPAWGKVGLTTHVSGVLDIVNGGTGATTRQDAIDALAGAVTSGQYLRGNGTDVVMSAIQAADVPTLNQNTTGTASNVTGTVAIANGGTGATTRQDAMDALAGAVTSGQYLRGNGTDVVMSAIQAADVPTLNQNTTGSAATFTSTTQNSQFNSLGVGTVASGTAGEIRATNNITAYYSSDVKFKENIVEIADASEIVRAIGGKFFDWTDAYIAEHGGEDGYFIQKQDFGVIAQDVLRVFPRAVRTRQDGSLAVDYEKLGVLAFPALVETMDRLAALEATVAQLAKGSMP